MFGFLGRVVAVAVAACLLVACGPNEASQREAFIAFLQTDVLSKKGVTMPSLTPETREKIGDYAAQFDVITKFHETMNDAVTGPMQQVMSKASPGTIEAVVKRRGDIEAVRGGIAKMRDALDQATASADQARAALKQPDDLAPVYAKAFDKLVTQPSAAVRELFPAMDEAVASVLALADLIERNGSKIKLNGMMVEASDEKVRAELETGMKAMSDKRDSVNAAVGKVRQVMNGE